MNFEKQKEAVERTFTFLGFKLIFFNMKSQSNGPDMYIQKEKQRPLSVEIKCTRVQPGGQLQCEAVSDPRRKDDLIAIIINSNYVLIEPMVDHLKCCSKKGTRQFTIMK